jgi:hypothetical protein
MQRPDIRCTDCDTCKISFFVTDLSRCEKLWPHYGFARAANASWKAARLFLSTNAVPVSTHTGMGGHRVHGNLGGPHVEVSDAVFESLNS